MTPLASPHWPGQTVLLFPTPQSPVALSSRRPVDVATLPVPANLVLDLRAWHAAYAAAFTAEPDSMTPDRMPQAWKEAGLALAHRVRDALPAAWRVGVFPDGAHGPAAIQRPTYLSPTSWNAGAHPAPALPQAA